MYWSSEFETPRISRHRLTAVAISGPGVPFCIAGTLDRRHRLDVGGTTIDRAPPEYVIARKLEFHREGGSDKHLRDIASMIASGCPLDQAWLEAELATRGLTTMWARLCAEGSSEP